MQAHHEAAAKLVEAAQMLALKNGLLHPTLQEIADAAGVSKSSVHYYFENREALGDRVFRETTEETWAALEQIMNGPGHYREKIRNLFNYLSNYAAQYPYTPLFIIAEMLRDPEKADRMEPSLFTRFSHTLLFSEMQQEISAGRLGNTAPAQLLINIFSLAAFPSMARPFFEYYLKPENESWEAFLSQSNEQLLQLL